MQRHANTGGGASGNDHGPAPDAISKEANIRTIGGLIRKKEKDLLDVDGMGKKGIDELKEILAKFDLSIKE